MAAGARVRFSTFDVTNQVFLRTPHVVGIVNLKPIVPCHVLLIPPDPKIKRLNDLPASSVAPFFGAVQTVVSRLEKALGCTSSNVAIQDGTEAGQTVPHLHVHILPRKNGDYERNDDIYEHLDVFGLGLKRDLERIEGEHGRPGLAPDDEDRKPRTAEEMRREAQWLSNLFSDLNM